MKVSKKERLKGLYEYIFWDALDSYNKEENMLSKLEKRPSKHIMVSEGRLLHDMWTSKVKTFGISENLNAMNEVLSERMGRKPFLDTSKNSKEFGHLFDKYKNLIGQNENAQYEGPEDNKSLVMTKDHCMPISPYDSRFRTRECVLQNGSRLGGISGDADVDEFTDLLDVKVARLIPYVGNVYEKVDNQTDEHYWVIDRPTEDSPKLLSDEDIAGLSRLKGFMTEKEYNAVKDWVISGMDVENLSTEAIRARDKGVERSVAILQGLSDMGYDYTISTDINPGQIVANITGTQIRVRVTDTPANAKYIGTVYDNGAEVRFKSTYVTMNPATKKNTHLIYDPTPEDSLNLVRFALGEEVIRKNDGDISGENGVSTRTIKGNQTLSMNKSFHTKNSFNAEYGKALDPNGKVDDLFGNVVRIEISHLNRSSATTSMQTASDADIFLRNAIDSARVNLANELNVDALIDDFVKNGENEDYVPILSENPEIATIQQSYIDVLQGYKTSLLKPSVSQADYDEWLSEAGEFVTSNAVDKTITNITLNEMTYDTSMDKFDMIKQHSIDMIANEIGGYERDEKGKRFNPTGVSKWMQSGYSSYRNNDDIIKAMKMLDIKAEEVLGDDFYNKTIKDRLAKFDYTTSKPMSSLDNEFMKGMYDEIKSSLLRNGVAIHDDNDIRIDDNGIVHYIGYVNISETIKQGSEERIEGEIGQIFEPNEENVVFTKFNSGQDYAFVPGYEARIVRQKPGETKSVEERTRLIGYEQSMRANIRYTLRHDLVSAGHDVGLLGDTTSLNSTYSHLYDERHPVDFIERYREQKMPESFIHTLIKTESQRVRYANTIRDNSTIHAAYMAENFNVDMENDNTKDPFVLTGGRNMSILTSEADGYFDPIATNATSTNQGVLRYLVNGATVRPDGFIEKSEIENDRCALMYDEKMKYSSFDPFDRQNMTVSNILDASSVTETKAKVAFMNFGGWNMDDGIPISKKFAESHNMRNHDGIMRNLVIGDKTSDLHGNKGVHSIIVDPDMDMEEAKSLGLEQAVAWFKANPELDVVMAPFSAPSRFNGGSARELLDGNVTDLISPDGKVLKGGIGELDFIITDKAADTKTHAYDDDDLSQGKGRRASAQLSWALNAKGADAMLQEIYGMNNTPLANLREMLITCGLDISEIGEIHRGYTPHMNEKRNVIEMPELKYIFDKEGKKRSSIDKKAMRKEFNALIEKSGGILEVPFEMKYLSGDPIPPLNDGKTDVIYEEKEWERKGYTRKDGVYVRPTTVHRKVEVGRRQTGDVTYGLPILSSYLRSGQAFDDGSVSTHDYTHQYEGIFLAMCEYQDAKIRKEHPELYTKPAVDKADSILESAPVSAQAKYNRIMGDLSRRHFEGKHNIFKDGIMSRRMPNSATAIWSEDPRLGINKIAVGRAVAESMGVKDTDSILVWRDPVLRDGALRYLDIKIDDNLTGVAINPVIAKSFDGDFDGDTVGLLKLNRKESRDEARRLFSVHSNLLDFGSLNKEGNHNLYLQSGLDIKVVGHQHPELAEELHNIEVEVNDFERKFKAGAIEGKEVYMRRRDAVNRLNSLYSNIFSKDYGTVYIAFDSPEHHIETIHEACVETGAKGSTAKVQGYASWAGFEAPIVDDKIDYENVVDKGETLATREMQQEVMYATATKSFGTGIAGSISQLGIKALRNEAPKAILELTYPVTQSILQSKHDAAEARAKYALLMGPVKRLWKGELLARNEEGHWQLQREGDGTPVRATVNEWKRMFKDLYTSSTADNGLNVDINPEYIDEIASHLKDEDGYILNVDSPEYTKSACMDKLAYGGSFEVLLDMADRRENLYSGVNNSKFMPNKVRINNEAYEVGEPVKGFTKTDTVEGGKSRNVGKQEKISVVRKEIQVEVPENIESNNEYEV